MGKKGKRKRRKVRGFFDGFSSNAAFEGFSKMIYLAFPIITVAFILWAFKSNINNVKLFSILMTLGGLETYDQTVIGILMLMLIVGAVILIWDD